jgi:chromosome segregation ATPase
VHWGPLPTDPIPLVLCGVNVAAGPNGAGKTCALDALKLMLGVETLKQRPRDWVFENKQLGQRAERAWVRVVIANPERPRRQGRVFADVGYGCESAEWVTAICEVNRSGRPVERRYTITAGYLTWGASRPIEQDITALRQIPEERWYGVTRWREILRRAGVPQALLRVISVRAGDTHQMVQADPRELLRRMLELTGKQQTIDEFDQARRDLTDARKGYAEARGRLHSEQTELGKLELLVRGYERWQQAVERLRYVEDVELPWIAKREKQAEIDTIEQELGRLTGANDRHRATLEELSEELPAREQELRDLDRRLGKLTELQQRAQRKLAAVGGKEALAADELAAAEALLAAAPQPLNKDVVEGLAVEAAEDERVLADSRRRAATLEGEIAELRAGRVRRPDELDAFRTLLTAHGIAYELLADRLEPGEHAIAAEAALGDGVWTLLVAGERLEAALELARGNGYRLPLAAVGAGHSEGVLAELKGAPGAAAYLAELDQPLREQPPGVRADGTVRGRTWGAFRAPERPVLGAEARARRLALLEGELAELTPQLPKLGAAATAARAAAQQAEHALEASERLPEIARRHAATAAMLAHVHERLNTLNGHALALSNRRGEQAKDLEARRQDNTRTAQQIEENEGKLAGLADDLAQLQTERAALSGPAGAEPQEQRSREVADSECKQLRDRLENDFAEEERTPEVLVHRDTQNGRVEEATRLLGEHDDGLKRALEQLTETRRRYDQNVREGVQRLAASFRDVCRKAAMTGELKLVTDETDAGQHELAVRVAHSAEAPIEALASYQSGAHSDGQKAKIAILLLLAAMAAEGASDLLIMDEHSAHLDSGNIDYIGEAMRALSAQAQFVLANPTTAEAARAAAWCDHQVAFFPPEDGSVLARLSIMTRRVLNEDELHVGEQIELAG